MKIYYRYLFSSRGLFEQNGESLYIERLYFISVENLRLSYLERKMRVVDDPFTAIVDDGTIARSGYDVATFILTGADIAPIYRANNPYGAAHPDGPGEFSFKYIGGLLTPVSKIDAISDGVNSPAEFMLRKKTIEALEALIEAERVAPA